MAEDLRRLGVCHGDILFVHSSFRSLGPVEGAATSVVGAFEDALMPDGLLLMPSFNLVEKRSETWNLETTPATTGWLTEFFRKMPGTCRSDHYSHSVAARGKNAAEFVSGHRSLEGYSSPWDLEPWGRTYGTHSPMIRAYRAGGKLLMLGVGYDSSTYMHVVEAIDWARRREKDPEAGFFYIGRNRPLLGEYWDSLGRVHRGRVGNAECRLSVITDFVDTLVAEVEAHPEKYYRGWPAKVGAP
ncbi:MAG: AAC(3) family N-acetyltransferase [Planctomycetes bacterium]|nr:AAC(3) family N-acetyltransferase [Planctomycetota bacterium]